MEAVSNQAETKSNAETTSAAWLIVAAAGVRTAFGVLMAIDAYLKWQPGFAAHYVGYLQNAANAQPHWLQPWFHMPSPCVFSSSCVKNTASKRRML